MMNEKSLFFYVPEVIPRDECQLYTFSILQLSVASYKNLSTASTTHFQLRMFDSNSQVFTSRDIGIVTIMLFTSRANQGGESSRGNIWGYRQTPIARICQ
jgi:hypothetical protein